MSMSWGRTMMAIAISMLTTYATSSLLSFFFVVLETDLNAGPTKLGLIVMCNRMVNAVAGVVWGWAADESPRIRLWIWASLGGALPTMILAASANYAMFLIVYASAAIGWSALKSVALSLVPDLYIPDERGKAMGSLGIAIICAAVLGVAVATAFQNPVGGVDGWRLAHLLLGLLQIPTVLIVRWLAQDPPRGSKEFSDALAYAVAPEYASVVPSAAGIEARLSASEEEQAEEGEEGEGEAAGAGRTGKGGVRAGLADLVANSIPILRNRGFNLFMALLTAQALPVSALSFMVLWFQYSGLSELGAGVAYTLAAIGSIVGSGVGGWVGDVVSRRLPNRGRLMVAQLAVLCNMGLLVVLLVVVPKTSYALIALVMFFIGLLLSIPAFASDLPNSAEVVPKALRGLAYALQGLVQGTVSSTGSLLVGAIAEGWFGYRERTGELDDVPREDKIHNRDALSKACLVVFLSCWSLQFVLYFVAYSVYPRVRDEIRAADGGDEVNEVGSRSRSGSETSSSWDESTGTATSGSRSR
ncbi:transmembrane domain-containing protein [Thecamonas trahens ATCC 50062]|uniref:Transmembrane domain-containing protein n=1 Tax=Thecamonas trahens ATCC 50062 TaxID=461836 RepID=A0A0L0DP76_THETB|nr:transmembrane domain-containing protein [Thecamonas trahens ATCC 50062]KNC54102.1 transmembrane domain-containing protein [Thecamonas trahens ATCC 50062]|eukprot:XP_013753925.1 transmembrane domain-containing protein [Thecamonas trahens ATCC 50062]